MTVNELIHELEIMRDLEGRGDAPVVYRNKEGDRILNGQLCRSWRHVNVLVEEPDQIVINGHDP